MATAIDKTIMVINVSSSTDGSDGDEQVSSLLATNSSAAVGLIKKKRRRWTCFDELRCYFPNSRKQLGPYQRSRLCNIIIALQYILPVVAFTLTAWIAMNHTDILLFEKEQVGGANEEEAIAMEKMKRLEEDKKERDRYDIKQRQIASYINNTGIILNVHITHHAGTSICNQMRQLGNTPDFACMERGRNDDTYWPQDAINKNQLFKKGQHNVGSRISYNDTGDWVNFWQQYFHYVSMEFGELRTFGSWGDYLHQTNWEYEGLVSMIVMRDPLERFLSRGKCGDFHGTLASGDPTNETQALYWEYANSDCADNYALRVLTENSVSMFVSCLLYSSFISLCLTNDPTDVSCLCMFTLRNASMDQTHQPRAWRVQRIC